MLTIIQKIDEIQKKISEIDNEIPLDCINSIVKHYFDKVVLKDNINKEEFDLLQIVIEQQNNIAFSNSFEELLGRMGNFCRERSNGACKLYKCLFPINLYNYLFKDLGKISYRSILIQGCEFIKEDNLIVGICQSKFKTCDIEQLIILGKISS